MKGISKNPSGVLTNNDFALQKTADGSSTIVSNKFGASYHSTHGALTETLHVFVKNGLAHFVESSSQKSVRIFEMGFGTGLNAIASANYAIENDVDIEYVACEIYPLPQESLDTITEELDQRFGRDISALFEMMHTVPSGGIHQICTNFSLEKFYMDFFEIQTSDKFDLVYYDAFGPGIQAELWSIQAMQKAARLLKKGGFLVTYCAQGAFRRHLRTLEFEIEKLAGPPGKREMTRAMKVTE